MPDAHRELGVEFGELAARLDAHEYPATDEELLDAYGDSEISYSGGAEPLAALLTPQEATFDSASDVRQSVLNAVGQGAVGRKAYTDRGTSASLPRDRNDVSF